MLVRLIFCLFLLFGYLDIISQCNISNFSISTSNCDQSGRMYVTLNFTPTGNAQKFSIIGNGKNYGNFDYSSLPVTLGPIRADCTTEFEFLIRDSLSNACQVYKKIGKVCCENLCKIRVSNITADNCQNTTYELGLGLKFLAPSEGFDVFNNGKLINTYAFSQLPIKIKGVLSNLNETFNEIAVCAHNDKICCDTAQIVNPCICTITNVRGQVIDCNNPAGKFSVKINFDHKTNSDSFRIGGNSFNYGIFAYKDLPITLKNIALSQSLEYEFLFIDKNNPFCFGSFEPGVVKSCTDTCKLEKLTIQQVFCDSNTATLSVILKDSFAGVLGFELFRGIQKVGNFKYGTNDFLIEVLKADCDSVYCFTATDVDNVGCHTDTSVKLDNCCHQKCTFSELKITENCQSNSLTDYFIDFKYSGVSDSFILKINSKIYRNFSYNDLPIKITEINFALPDVIFGISDSKSDTCKLEKQYTVKCYSPPKCTITDFMVKQMACDKNGNYFATMQFKVKDPSSSGFRLSVNGVGYDSMEYGKVFYIIGPFKGDCTTKNTFSATDIKDSLCSAVFSFSDSVCCKICKLSDPSIVVLPCSNGKYSLKVDFKRENHSESFEVFINNKSFGFYRYADLPIVINGLDEKKELDIGISDKALSSCNLYVTIPGVECISGINVLYQDKIDLLIDAEKIVLNLKTEIDIGSIVIYDISGRVILIKELNSNLEIDISQWQKGMYLACIKIGAKISWKRMIKT